MHLYRRRALPRPINHAHLCQLRAAGHPLFEAGERHVSAAVRKHLRAHQRDPENLVRQHCLGTTCLLPSEAAKNDQALLTGGQLMSRHLVGDREIWILSSRESDNGERYTTLMLFLEELPT